MKNKRGISVIIGYVLLIVIAIGLSIAVFGFLRAYLPKEMPECETDVKLIIREKSCDFTARTLTLKLENKGLFSADAAFIRFAESDRTVREWINNPDKEFISYFSEFLFCLPVVPPATEEYDPDKCQLKPGDTHDFDLDVFIPTPGEYTIEVQPAVFVEDAQDPVVCEQAVITQDITCT